MYDSTPNEGDGSSVLQAFQRAPTSASETYFLLIIFARKRQKQQIHFTIFIHVISNGTLECHTRNLNAAMIVLASRDHSWKISCVRIVERRTATGKKVRYSVSFFSFCKYDKSVLGVLHFRHSTAVYTTVSAVSSCVLQSKKVILGLFSLQNTASQSSMYECMYSYV